MPNTMFVDVKFEDGSELRAILAESIDWGREGDEDDIVAYRQSPEPHEVGATDQGKSEA